MKMANNIDLLQSINLLFKGIITILISL